MTEKSDGEFNDSNDLWNTLRNGGELRFQEKVMKMKEINDFTMDDMCSMIMLFLDGFNHQSTESKILLLNHIRQLNEVLGIRVSNDLSKLSELYSKMKKFPN